MRSTRSALRDRAALRAGLLLALCASLLAVPERAGAQPGRDRAAGDTGFTQQVLFKAAHETGYSCFRIPAVVRTAKGTLLAFAEGRVRDCGDAGDIDVVVKRSVDGGRTWGPLRVVSRGDGDTHGNPVPVVDHRTGRILLAQTFNAGRTDGKSCESPCDRTPHLQYSDDDGNSWSPPRDLTAQLRPDDWNSWYATGPGHGLQLRHGRHAGRLVLGVNAETWQDGRNTGNHAALVYSDDGGDNWRRGATDSHPYAAGGTFRQKPQELTLHERRDGAVLASARETEGTDLGHRTTAVSSDGGASFEAPFRALPGLYTPQVQGSVLRLGGSGRLLLSAPADPDRRRTMSVRSSYDEGATWESVDRGRTVTADWSGYSDLVQASADEVGLLYEGGAADARDEIRFARFTEGWLGPRRGPDPVTPDGAPGAGDASVLGGPVQVSGRHGRALEFDGRDDAVRLPFHRRLPLGERDFSARLWFRYTADADSGEQPLLWMGGVGTAQPQVRLVADPAAGRITAAVTARQLPAPAATAEVATAGAYNDGRWHRAELRRGGGQLRLTVDGESVSAPDVPGSVSVGSPFGVHLGQKVDSRAHFTGALDEVQVRTGNRSVLNLPLDSVRTPQGR
ncbi:laminin G [Streptomyces abyssalis]|uniref:exo-alpha-sialidase n=1 Tax=Streptomyces abyssalis TaxID=933944 RepID=A0A1E7JS50_9ACTN|nr:exo-alpha-sialidase [Streptomyces abyssalis]OEU91735.1 laminin G [Streptomyces abyssalis]OEU94127.1 laminin G [Streptomyces abyssalis]